MKIWHFEEFEEHELLVFAKLKCCTVLKCKQNFLIALIGSYQVNKKQLTKIYFHIYIQYMYKMYSKSQGRGCGDISRVCSYKFARFWWLILCYIYLTFFQTAQFSHFGITKMAIFGSLHSLKIPNLDTWICIIKMRSFHSLHSRKY